MNFSDEIYPHSPRSRFDDLHRMQDEVIQSARESNPPHFDGAGIVIVAGGGRCFTNAYVALFNLRSVVRTELPIQLWYLGPEEMSPEMKRIVGRFDVELIDAHEVRRQHPIRRLGGWECKVFAAMHTRFRHVVLLDADNVPLIDPASLLDLPEYASTGTIFWPDNQSHPQDSLVWDLFRVPSRYELEVESGQLVVDKERCWLPLNLALHFNAWSDIYYRYIYGDKETFHFAWRRLGQPYAMPDGRPSIIYCQKETPHGRKRMTAALEQRDFAGNVIFHHRTGAEWVLFGENQSTSRSDLEAVCLAALEELRSQWDGRVAPDPLVSERINGRDAITTRHYRYRRLGVDERRIEFEEDGHIGHGATQDEHSWRIEDTAGTQMLVLSGSDGDTSRLTRDRDTAWRGKRLWYEQGLVELVPVEVSDHRT